MKPVYVGIRECDRVRGVAVVIDVLRAYTTAAWAFHLGVGRIVLSDDVEEALRIKASIPGALALKDSDPVEGFELSNSPVELQSAGDLRGRIIVQRTTHGTVGAVAARAAEHLFCATFSNAAATAKAVRDLAAEEVFYVVTGRDGVAEEDRACAEYIAALIEDQAADAAPFIRRALDSETAALLQRRVETGRWGIHPDDIEASVQVNAFDFVMRAADEDGLLTLRAYNQR